MDNPDLKADSAIRSNTTVGAVYVRWGRNECPPQSELIYEVCWSPNRPSLIMIPARNICPGSEWTKEYSGYLVSGYYNHGGRTEYVCMDRNAEAIPRSVHNANGALFYAVEGRCGSSGSGLPCGPYVDGYELTCAVCTR
ncbi:hypothetical protein HOLleu_06284 [Holothuria leucospilota]|uniref:Short-chain collagen C4-like n=1 Tax=Holothuria leucospilota TaxID=206669 RepID=A0A9Q1HJG5_HOLLE|nr:hypothetical protein HOLleu_06284 [Holothuria leucospilota]